MVRAGWCSKFVIREHFIGYDTSIKTEIYYCYPEQRMQKCMEKQHMLINTFTVNLLEDNTRPHTEKLILVKRHALELDITRHTQAYCIHELRLPPEFG